MKPTDILSVIACALIILSIICSFSTVCLLMVHSEKIAAIEDVVFNYGIYKQIEKGVN